MFELGWRSTWTHLSIGRGNGHVGGLTHTVVRLPVALHTPRGMRQVCPPWKKTHGAGDDFLPFRFRFLSVLLTLPSRKLCDLDGMGDARKCQNLSLAPAARACL